MSDVPDLSIVVVNWNSVHFLRRCLASIYAHTKNISIEVLVVDNASFDGCREMVEREFALVQFIQSLENVGFGRANNLGATRSSGRNLLFLNPDAEVVEGACEEMVSCLESAPNIGVVGPKVLNSDFSIQTSCVQSFPSILNQILDSEYLRRMFPRSSLWGNRLLFEGNRGPVAVEAISGASLMVRRNVFERVGRFKREYFMYAEDIDLCYRVREAGWRVCYTGGAIVIHHGGRSASAASDSHFSAVMMRESVERFIRVHRGSAYARAFRAATALSALCRLSVLGLVMVLPLDVLRRRSVLLAFRKWTRVFRWAMGFETWARQAP